MIDIFQHLSGAGLEHAKIHEQAGAVQGGACQEDLHLPVVAVEVFAFTVKVFQPMGGGKLMYEVKIVTQFSSRWAAAN